MTVDDAFRTLGLAKDVGAEVIRKRYRDLARSAHPDAGGTTDRMTALRSAHDAALAFALSPRDCGRCEGEGKVVVHRSGFRTYWGDCADCGGTGRI